MDAISALVKSVFGAIFGFFIGVVVTVLDVDTFGMVIGVLLLDYLLFATSVVEIGGALILGFIVFAIGSYFGLVGTLANRFPVADALGWSAGMDTFFSLLIIFMAALVLVKILWTVASDAPGLPEGVNWGCGVIIGVIFVVLLFWGASSGSETNITTWVIGGGIIGFLLSFIPGHPML